MNGLILGMYGLFLIAVGLRGNTDALMTEAEKDAPAFIPWALAIAALAVMNNYETSRPIVRPFIVLLILNFVLLNFDNIKSELQKLYSLSGSN